MSKKSTPDTPNSGGRAANAKAVANQHIKCRTLGHAWDQGRIPPERHKYGHLIIFTCRDCGCQRHDVFTHFGRINVRRYVQPEGYGLEGVPKDERPRRSDYLVEWMTRRGVIQ